MSSISDGLSSAEGETGGGNEITRIDRELSWLRFNARVLQEAEDRSVPLFERFNFLSIFSSNLDEFFRVRVASLRALMRLKKKRKRKLGVRPKRLLRAIRADVVAQQERFGRLFREELIPELAGHGIDLIQGTPTEGTPDLERVFAAEVQPELEVLLLEAPSEDGIFLEDRTVYLAVELWPKGEDRMTGPPTSYALVRVPSPPLPRFVQVEREGRHNVHFLDDVIRLYLDQVFPEHSVGSAYAVKLSRDADLYLEDEFGLKLVEAIRKSLAKRDTGAPSRFLYDLDAPPHVIDALQEHLGLEDDDLVPGGRYHNLHDLRDLPRFGRDDLEFEPWPAVAHPGLQEGESVLEAMRTSDQLLHFPYHDFGHVVRYFEEAADDPDVERLHLTVYRVARDSRILRALVRAAESGKHVQVFFEVQARFDEASNLEWASRLEDAGARVDYSIPGLKVHAKVALVVRREGDELRRYAFLGTGNFNETTARFYTDLGLLTTHPEIAQDVDTLFAHLAGALADPTYARLMVAPAGLRPRLIEKVQREIEAAAGGRPAGIELKLNALQDPEMIEELVAASRAGVSVDAIVRGICCLAPGIEGESESIRIHSIIDRFLEHSRVYRFHAGGEDEIWLASADWMTRNLSRRIEVAFPILDPRLADQVRTILRLQKSDGVKSRRIDTEGLNSYASLAELSDTADVGSQEAHRVWLDSLVESPSPAAT